MRLILFTALAFLLCKYSIAQWDPNAGIVPSYTSGATVITSGGGSGALAIDGDNNTAWQTGGTIPVLPTGYLGRPDLNILLGLGSTVQCKSSANANATNTTDGGLNSFAQIAIGGGSAWIRYDLSSPVTLRHITVKCGVASPISIYAFKTNGDSTLLGILQPSDNFGLRRFSPMLANVVKIKLVSSARFSLFEAAALAKIPTEYITVDLGQTKQVGYIETRHWADGGAVSTAIYVSNNNVNWTLVGTVNPNSLYSFVTRPVIPVQARYVKVEHSMVEVDYTKAFVWEIRVFDKSGPYGTFPAPRPRTQTTSQVLGVNGIWGWNHNMFSSSIPQGQGPTKFNKVATHARNYHDMHWDVDDPDMIPDYDNMPFGLALWWLDWDREYQAWNDAGFKVQASIQFTEWNPATRMSTWDDPYTAAYNYGYAFADHFGPTNGNGLVDMVEVGNEPWTYPASFYLNVLRGMLQGIKDADPAMKALPCALQSADPTTEAVDGGNWMGARLTQNEAPYIEGINIHHYSYTYDGNGVRIAVHPEHPESDMRGVLNDIRFRDKNLPGKKIYLSEWGWDSDGAGENCLFGECVSEHEQAIYGVRGAMMFTRLGIDRLTWYFFGNQGSGNLYSRSGMLGSPVVNFAEKKSFRAFEAYVNLLGDKYFLDTLREDNTAWIYLFGDSLGNPTHIAAWRPVDGDNSGTIQVNLNTTLQPDSAWTIQGNNRSGELAALPSYANGLLTLQLSAIPLIIKVHPHITVNFVWTGNISGDWNSPLNWNVYRVPSATSEVTIPSGRPHYPDTYNTDPVAGTLTINSGSHMIITPGNDLYIQNSLTLQGGTLNVTGIAGTTPVIYLQGDFIKNTGTFNHGKGKVVFNGTVPQAISGAVNFHDLEIDNNSALTINSPIVVEGILGVMSTSALVTNNKLTIESGGSIMHGEDTPGGQEGSIQGGVTVKRKGSTNARYNYWSSPVQSASALLMGFNRYYYNPSNATDMSEQGLRAGWVYTSGMMQPCVGYIGQGLGMVSFNGDVNSAATSNPVRVTVTKNVGSQNDVPFNLVGNPFPSAMDAFKFIAANGPDGSGEITGALYFWDDDGSGGSGWNAAQDYAVWSGAGLVAGPNSSTIFNGNIASCQSFFVEKVDDGSGSLVFDNSMRTTENNSFFRLAPVERLWVSITNPSNNYNEALIAFMNDATDGVDLIYDAKKMKGNASIAFYSKLIGNDYAIQALSPLTADKTVSLGFKTTVAGTQVISLKAIENIDETVAVLLEDRTLGVFQNLRAHPSYSFYSVAGTFDQRFYLHFTPPLEMSITAQKCEDASGQLLFNQPGNRQWDVFVTNMNGVQIAAEDDFSGTFSLDVPGGFYMLTLADNYGYQFTKFLEIPLAQGVDAVFSCIDNDFRFATGEELFFRNGTTGADYYEWDFGDGTSSIVEEPVHTYAVPGVYEVALHAWNNNCDDITYKTITVTGTRAVLNQKGDGEEINTVNDSRENITVYGFENKLYVNFDFPVETKAMLVLHDITGKQLLARELSVSDVHVFDLPSVARSIYLYRITTAQGIYSDKILLGQE